MCRFCVGYKNRDIKTTEVVARGTKQNTGAFCFSQKTGFCFVGVISLSFFGLFQDFYWYVKHQKQRSVFVLLPLNRK